MSKRHDEMVAQLARATKSEADELLELVRNVQPVSADRNPTLAARKQCAEWLVQCLQSGWNKTDLGVLESLWWEYHDDRGVFMEVTR